MIDGRDSFGHLKSLKLGIESWLFRFTARRKLETKKIHNFTGAISGSICISANSSQTRGTKGATARDITPTI